MESNAEETWEVAGRQVAREWLRTIDPEEPLIPQIAFLVAEHAARAGGVARPTAWGVVHHACPWADWHERRGLGAICQRRCDAWYAAVAETLGEALGIRLRIQTLQSIPEGAPTCARRITDV